MGYETNPSYDELVIEVSQLRKSNDELRRYIRTLSNCIHNGYDFNKDEASITVWEGKILRGEI